MTIVADNVYADGYYFNMGKHRNGGVSTITEDSRTNAIKTPNGDNASIRVTAVRPDDVTKIGKDPAYHNYYYGGSEQNGDENYDVDGTVKSNPFNTLSISIQNKIQVSSVWNKRRKH